MVIVVHINHICQHGSPLKEISLRLPHPLVENRFPSTSSCSGKDAIVCVYKGKEAGGFRFEGCEL